MNRKIGRNIGLDYSFTFMNNLNLLHALWMIWLALNGFSLLELGILEGVFHLTSFLMEVPTGAVADLWGRKQSRVLGRIFFLGSLLFLWFSDSLFFQALGFVLTAISYNLESGAGEALVYDSLAHLKREDEFTGIRGKKELIFQMASIIAFLAGGYLAVKSYSIVFGAALAIGVLSVLNALLMEEPPIERSGERVEGGIFRKIGLSLFNQTRDSLLVIRKEPRIAYLILFSEGIFVFATTQYFYLQTWWKFEGYSEFYMGIVFAIQCLLAGMSAVAAPVLDRRFGALRLMKITPLLLLLSLWGCALFHLKAPFFILTGLFEGVLIVSISNYINALIPGEYRATILSYQSMVFSFLMILIFPVTGWVGDLHSLDLSFYVIAVTASAVYLLYRFFISPGKMRRS
ncbi:MAG: MFS transporter [Spirochaetales bacterium]|nr:MFS transporter [Spirochaetales bacterium]